MPDSLASLRARLVADEWRLSNGFTDDINDANEVLLDTLSTDSEREKALMAWVCGHLAQPCAFGKIAGLRDGMHYCTITSEDLEKSDGFIREKIAASRKLWKQRAAIGIPTHGFMLVVCDRDVAFAKPDQNLRSFSFHLRSLVDWIETSDIRENHIFTEWLYLKHPKSDAITKFSFSVDFFAAAADGRWWHDHRTPGGIAFTANSLGHMVRYHEWYKGKANQVEWALRTAMDTIASATSDYPHCPVTSLLDMVDGKPKCPFTWNESVPLPNSKKLAGKDHGSYVGYLHTDHAIRKEFFQDQDQPVYLNDPYDMDFTYIFDTNSVDNLAFMRGEAATVAEVEAEIGAIGGLRTVSAVDTTTMIRRPKQVGDKIGRAIERLESRMMSEEEIEELLK